MKSNKTVMLTVLMLMAVSTTGCADRTMDRDAPPPPPPGCVPGKYQDVVRDHASGTVVHATDGTCVRTKWIVDQDPCVPAVMTPVPDVKILSKEDQTVYFGFNQASLSPEMIARLDALSASLKGNSKIVGVRIVGYADRIGNAGYNEKLSKKRAENVRQYLVAKGLIKATLAKTRWVGSKDSKSSCGSNLKRTELIECLRKDRRVEIELDYAPDVHAGHTGHHGK